jgi:tRNA threonylcarbamoyladenosine biosynthesis protein TsaB
MALSAKNNYTADYYLASIDARRNDIFYALYGQNMEVEMPIAFSTLHAELFSLYDNAQTCVTGSGANKVSQMFSNIKIVDVKPSAKNMGEVALQKFLLGEFEDVAYYEPKYHKDFYTTYKPKSL